MENCTLPRIVKVIRCFKLIREVFECSTFILKELLPALVLHNLLFPV